jgi:hypothetical protein
MLNGENDSATPVQQAFLLQQRQIDKALGKHIKESKMRKDVLIRIYSIAWMLIAVNVTIYRNISLQKHQSISHCIMMMTTKPRSRI